MALCCFPLWWAGLDLSFGGTVSTEALSDLCRYLSGKAWCGLWLSTRSFTNACIDFTSGTFRGFSFLHSLFPLSKMSPSHSDTFVKSLHFNDCLHFLGLWLWAKRGRYSILCIWECSCNSLPQSMKSISPVRCTWVSLFLMFMKQETKISVLSPSLCPSIYKKVIQQELWWCWQIYGQTNSISQINLLLIYLNAIEPDDFESVCRRRWFLEKYLQLLCNLWSCFCGDFYPALIFAFIFYWLPSSLLEIMLILSPKAFKPLCCNWLPIQWVDVFPSHFNI